MSRGRRATPHLPTLRRRPRLAPTLQDWYRGARRDLPWRHTRDPYHIWISEIMLQQTRVETVIPYYERFLVRYPDVATLAASNLDELLKLWEGLGYYARARHLHRAAQQVVTHHGGELPQTLQAVQALPGVGRSTAASILCFAHGQRHPILDGNLKRVLLRLYDFHADKGQPVVERWLWQAAQTLLADAPAPDDHNQALLDLGATVCTPRAPACGSCPLRRWCDARRAGTQLDLPQRRRARATPHHVIAVGVVRRSRGAEVLIQRRPAEGLLGGLWEFPGGKRQDGERLPDTVRRELREELGIEVEVGAKILALDHAYSHFSITLHAYHCVIRRGRPRPRAADAIRWVPLATLTEYAFPRANQRVLERLLQEARGHHDSS